MKVAAIIQARMGSTRLPGKVLLPLGDTTVLGHVVRRTAAAPAVDTVVVATTESPADAAIIEEATRLDAKTFRGSEEDVLSRYFFAAQAFGADVIVRATSDCPLLDPQLLEAMVQRFKRSYAGQAGLDYLSNTVERSYPRGLDVEVFTSAALERAHHEARIPAEREHVTPYLYRQPELFRIGQQVNPRDLSSHRWTLDTEDDWKLIRAVFEHLYVPGRIFTTEQVLDLLADNPALARLNAHVQQSAVGTER